MKISQFNGGLSTRLAPELIQPNEATVCSNVDTTTGQLKSELGPANEVALAGSTPFYFAEASEWFFNADQIDYLVYQRKLYSVDDVSGARKYLNGVWYNLGIEQPTTAPTVSLGAGTSGLDGVYQYTYTYYNVTDGTESQPAPISDEITVTGEDVDITYIASLDPQVTHIKIYRIGGALLSFQELVEVSNVTGTYNDTSDDLDTIGGVLASTLNGVPPAGLRYLAESYGTFFGAVDSKLYFSRDIGNPNYWPETNYINFNDTITGVKESGAGVIVATYYQTYIITGTNIASFNKQLLSASQGCINYKTMANLGGEVLFVSNDGICAASGGGVQVLSRNKLGTQLLDTVNALAHEEVYYVQLADNSILALDIRFGGIFKKFDFDTTWLVLANDKLYGSITPAVFELFVGSPVEYHYTTGNITDGASSMLKSYDEIFLSLEGEHVIDIYIDDIFVASRNVTGAAKPVEISIPQDTQQGSRIRFDLSGIGTVREIQYNVVVKTNG